MERVPEKSEITNKDEASGYKENYRELKREAKAEFRNTRDNVAKTYELRMEEAKKVYLQECANLREQLQSAREQAKMELQDGLESARNEYDLTVDIAKDQYRTLRRETTKLFKKGKKNTKVFMQTGFDTRTESAPTRVIMRLDEEIQRIADKRAATEQAGKDDALLEVSV